MVNKRFFGIIAIMLLLFVAVFGSTGCNGGHSSNFVDNGYTDPDPTPTPDPTPEDFAQSEVEYVLSHIAIGYQNGDNPSYVTRNLTLPTSTGEVEDIAITWTSSNPTAISSSGTVNRQTSDTNVTLTVKATKDTVNAERNFAITVIRQRSRTIEQAKAEIQDIGVSEIRAMNTDNDELQITYTASRDRVTDIDGKYTDITINTADDALDAVQSLHGILGINDPYAELEPSVITSDSYGVEYTFAQVYDGVRVFGRNITVSANSEGEGDFITSSIVPSLRLAESDLNFVYSKEQAESSAKMYYMGSFDIWKDMTEKAIFSLYGYENAPVPAYIVNVYGIDEDGRYLDENIFVNARNGKIIFSTTNIHNAIEYRTENDELGNPRTFPVVSEHSENGTIYYLRSPDVNSIAVELYNNIPIPPFQATYGENDAQQISAYANMIDVMNWWKASFGRNSLDDKGMVVKVVAHQRIGAYHNADGTFKEIMKDNAFWWGKYKSMFVCDAESYTRSCASAVEVMAHESTHAVFEYMLSASNVDEFPYICSIDIATGNGPATGAIDEGYADIFGCLMSEQWLIGRNIRTKGSYIRNVENPDRKTVSEAYVPDDLETNGFWDGNDNGGVHQNSSLVSYPAYLMYSNGLTWDELASLWYKSMRMGYNGESTFLDVRTCVIRAARKLRMSKAKIDVIKKAFEDVGIVEQPAILKGTVSKYKGEGLPNVSLTATQYYTAFGQSITGRRSYNTVTDSNGNYSLNLPEGTYSIDVTVTGYVPFSAVKRVEEGADNIVNISLVTPTGSHISTITGTIRDALTSYSIGGGELKIWKGWNVHAGYTVAETVIDDDGTYELPLFAGYYTAEFSKEGYATTSISNFVISSDETLKRDIILPPAGDQKYRVTLQWDRKPQFLDSHLIGRITYDDNSSETFHVYYVSGYRTAYDKSGNVIAMIEQNDSRSYGFETITFDMKPFDKFKYYVHWWSQDYGTTWEETNAVVNLYKGSQLIKTFIVPQVKENGYWRYWRVFDLISGLDPIEPNSDEAIVTIEPTLDN